jgi:hypothetical protein
MMLMTKPDNEFLYDEIDKHISSGQPRDSLKFRWHVATIVLFFYADGTLGPGVVWKVARPFAETPMYWDLIDDAWRTREFKKLGEIRKAFFYSRWQLFKVC